MSRRLLKSLFYGLALLPALGGLGLKLALGPDGPAEDRAGDWAQIGRAMAASGLMADGRTDVTGDGSYSAARFKAFGCQGSLTVVPLYRNAEGAVLLAEQVGTAVRFASRGESHDSFPSLAPVLADVRAKLGSPAPLTAPVVAYAETGHCSLGRIALALTAAK